MERTPSVAVDDVKNEPETINIWELMKDLDEDNDGVPPLDSSQSTIPLLLEPSSVKAAHDTIKPSSPPTLCPLNLDDNVGMHMGFTGGYTRDAAWVADRRSRPRSFTSIRCVEDTNAASSSSRRSRMPLPAWREGSRGTEPNALKYSSVLSSSSLLPSEACVQNVVSGSGSDWNPNNLQRALSFKYIFNQSNGNVSQHTPSHAELLASQPGRANADNSAPVCNESKSLLHDYDGMDSTQSSALRSVVVPDTFQTFRQAGESKSSAHSLIPPKVEKCKYVPGTIGSMLTEKFANAPGKTSRSMLDPEFLESFEKAMEQFSEEERNAVSSSREEVLRRNKQTNYNEGVLKTRGSADYPTSTIGSRSLNYLLAAGNEAGQHKSASHPKHSYSFEINHSKDGRRTSASRRNSMDMRKASGGEKVNEDAAVLFYSTDSQTDLKVYEDCNTVRAILRSILGAAFDERNILQYPDYDEELRRVLDAPVAVVPTLVVKGKLVVGIDSVLHLHKKGLLGSLLKEALPNGGSGVKAKAVCVCRGGKFLICSLCKGRGKVLRHSEGALSCRQCSGTGLIKCPNCLFG